jgi:glycosyltransferase involved in cell wall biosynthesis
MKKRRVIIIRNAKSYDFGGGERFPVFLAMELSKFDYKPLIVSRSLKLLAFADHNEIKTVRGWWWSWQNWSGKFALLFPFYILWQLILSVWYFTLFVKNNPDIIHIQSKDDFIAAIFAGKLLGKRVIWTDHADLKHIWRNIGIWYKNPVGKMVYLAAKLADAITVVSKSELRLVSKNLSKNSYVHDKLQVIYNGVEDVSSKYENNSHRDQFVFCTVSRLVTDKGIKEIIEAFTELSKEHAKLKLEIIGDGPEEAKFKKIAEDSQNINFLGYQKDPLGYVANSDVYLHATYHEGFSVSLVEASMMKKPIIATAVGGNLEIIHDRQTGLLVPVKDTNALYEAMKLLHKNSKLRQKLAENARIQYEKNFQFDQIVKEKIIPLYEKGKK